jgi:hypothetical protein
VVQLGNALAERNSAFDRCDRRLRTTGLQGDDAKVVQATDMVLIARKHLPVQALSLEQPAGLMMLDRRSEQRPGVRPCAWNDSAPLTCRASLFAIHRATAD